MKRPTEPGHWWYIDELGNMDVARVEVEYSELYVSNSDWQNETLDDFIVLTGMQHWIAKAVPPNDCYSCRWENSCDDMEPCNICEPTGFTEWESK